MIFKLHRRTDLALRAMRQLAEANHTKLTGPDLAKAVGTTPSFLPQVLSPLIRAGWIVSERGPGGGYVLTEHACSASLHELVEATEGPTIDGRCVLEDASRPGDHAFPVHLVTHEARSVLVEGFRQIPTMPHQGAKP